MNNKDLLDFWLKNADQKTVGELKLMKKKELEEAFQEPLEFGTAGIRGVIGPGTSGFNKYTIVQATYGFAKYIKEVSDKKNPLIIIGSDNRTGHKEFTKIASEILSSFGIKVLLKPIMPTPMISFLIIDSKADGGINITASHNPPEYNGYKVYGSNGAQLLPSAANRITHFSNERDEWLTYKWKANEELISNVPEKQIEKYVKKVEEVSINKTNGVKVSFSPQHGTSSEYLPSILKKLGHEVIEVKEQMSHDSNFKGTKSPNPENESAYELPIKYAIDNDCDIVIINDPDADRLGVAAKNSSGKFKTLTGNQLAPIMLDYIIKNNKESTPKYVVASFVTSHIGKLICLKYGIEYIEIATGFKWVADVYETIENKKFIFGYEESYGSLIDPKLALDKDGLQASVLVAEIAAKLKEDNKSLWDKLHEIYDEYKWFNEETSTINFKGVDSNKKRNDFMTNLRDKAHIEFKDAQVDDLSRGMGFIQPMNLIKLTFEDGSWICIRPSGTEPKIKFYNVAVGDSELLVNKRKEQLNEIVKKIKEIC